jgi:hypothetical protein
MAASWAPPPPRPRRRPPEARARFRPPRPDGGALRPGLPGRPAKAAARRDAAAAITWTRSATWSRKASSGGRCPRTCRTGAPSTTWPTAGIRAGRRGRCTMSFAASAASRPGARPSPRQARHLGQDQAQAKADTRDRQAAWCPAHLPGPARRWVAGRTLAWITRCRRTVRDCERLPGHHETIVYRAMTITMTRRFARPANGSAGHHLKILNGGGYGLARHGLRRKRAAGGRLRCRDRAPCPQYPAVPRRPVRLRRQGSPACPDLYRGCLPA